MVRCPVAEAAVVVLWLSKWNREGAGGQVAVAGGGGEEGFALAQGDEQQIGGAALVPEHAFAVDPGGVCGEDAEGDFDLGAAGAAVHAQVQVPRYVASEDIDERFRVNCCLAKHACQCPYRQITAMERHYAGHIGVAPFRVGGLSSQHHMAAFLTHDLETETLQSGDDGGRRQPRQLRQR